MSTNLELMTISDPRLAAEHRFFCYQSEPNSARYRRKVTWLEQRFEEGLEIRIIREAGSAGHLVW